MDRLRTVGAAVAFVALAGCDNETSPPIAGDEPAFPATYATSYVEVRNCRQSGDHDLNIIRIVADPVALAPYRDRLEPFPEGAVVLKEEYEFDDMTCSGAIKQWTVMVRLADGTAPDELDWKWQRVDAARNVTSVDEPRCYGCHTACTADNDGYEHTCAVP